MEIIVPLIKLLRLMILVVRFLFRQHQLIFYALKIAMEWQVFLLIQVALLSLTYGQMEKQQKPFPTLLLETIQ